MGACLSNFLLCFLLLSIVEAQQTCQCQNGGDTIQVSGENDAEAEAAALESLRNSTNAMVSCFQCSDGVTCSLDPNDNPCFELIITSTLFGQSLGTLTCTEQNEMLTCDAVNPVPQNSPPQQSTPTPSTTSTAEPLLTPTSSVLPVVSPTSSNSVVPKPSSLPTKTPTVSITQSVTPIIAADSIQPGVSQTQEAPSLTPSATPSASTSQPVTDTRRTARSFGDPHVWGFDGTHFDFHGKPGRYYAIFGIVGRELLTTRMRSSRYHIWELGITKTYFDEFGLTLSDGTRVHVSLVGNETTGWRASVYVNDIGIKGGSSYKSEDDSIVVNMDGTGMKVMARTKVATYTFSVVQAKEERHHHLNVEVEVNAATDSSTSAHAGTSAGADAVGELTQYVGVLGMTMNHAKMFKVDPVLHTEKHTHTTEIRERAMRKYFGVNSLFPPMRYVTPYLGGITARFSVASRANTVVRHIAMLKC